MTKKYTINDGLHVFEIYPNGLERIGQSKDQLVLLTILCCSDYCGSLYLYPWACRFHSQTCTECCKAKVAASCSDVGDVASIEVDALTCQQEKVDLAPKPEIHKDIFSVGCVTFHDAMSKAAPALCEPPGGVKLLETPGPWPWPVARGPSPG